jgi:hypothetical protein
MGCRMAQGDANEVVMRELHRVSVVERDRPGDLDTDRLAVLADRVVMTAVFAAFAFVLIGLLQGWL